MIEQHEKRISKIEENLIPLYGLPDQIEQLIELFKETNQNIKDLAKVSPTKELCEKTHDPINEFIKEHKKKHDWMDKEILLGLLVIVGFFIKVFFFGG